MYYRSLAQPLSRGLQRVLQTLRLKLALMVLPVQQTLELSIMPNSSSSSDLLAQPASMLSKTAFFFSYYFTYISIPEQIGYRSNFIALYYLSYHPKPRYIRYYWSTLLFVLKQSACSTPISYWRSAPQTRYNRVFATGCSCSLLSNPLHAYHILSSCSTWQSFQ